MSKDNLGFKEADALGFVEEPYTTPTVGSIEAGARGALQGATMGYSDEMVGGLSAAWDKLRGNTRPIAEIYAEQRDKQRAIEAAASQQNPAAYGAGELGGSIASLAIPGMGVAKAGKLAMVGKEALRGAATGAGTSQEALGTEGSLAEMAKAAALNAMVGGAGLAATTKLGKVAASPATTDLRNTLATKAAGLEPEDIASSGITSISPEKLAAGFGKLSESISPLSMATSSKPGVAQKMITAGEKQAAEWASKIPAPPVSELIPGASGQLLGDLAKKKATAMGPKDLFSAPAIALGAIDLAATGGIMHGVVGALGAKKLGESAPQIGTAALNALIKGGRMSSRSKELIQKALATTPQQANAVAYGLQQEDPLLREELKKAQSGE